jgi:hypothetical protein
MFSQQDESWRCEKPVEGLHPLLLYPSRHGEVLQLSLHSYPHFILFPRYLTLVQNWPPTASTLMFQFQYVYSKLTPNCKHLNVPVRWRRGSLDYTWRSNRIGDNVKMQFPKPVRLSEHHSSRGAGDELQLFCRVPMSAFATLSASSTHHPSSIASLRTNWKWAPFLHEIWRYLFLSEKALATGFGLHHHQANSQR